MVNCCDVRVVKDALVELGAAVQKVCAKDSAAIKSSATTLQSLRLGAYPNAFSIPPPDAANHTLRQVDYNITPDVFQSYAKE